MYNPFTLEAKTIFVSGASSGIGKSIAVECSRMGANLIITGRNTERLNNTFLQLEGGNHIQIAADLQTDAGIGTIVEKVPSLDGIVHCAGITRHVPFKLSGREVINDVMQINFNSPAIISQLLLKNKKVRKGASFVFISSVAGVLCSWIGNSAYSASKGAINGLIKGMALDLASSGIRVNSVNPAMIDTDILSSGVITNEQMKADMDRYPLKRYGKPEEVAFLAIYLLSDASAWMTGSSLTIDGGYTLI
jgi:NAD(P)-dependent dehydrogenase (short-subunit alcohol dehydrogenase family)